MSDQLKNPATYENIRGWQIGPTFECMHCHTSAVGSLASAGYFGEPIGATPPPGWLRRPSSLGVIYACSIKCANAIDEGTDL